MGRYDVSLLRYLTAEHFRVLTAVELGMRNHELVPHRLVAVIANLRHGGVHKVLRDLARHRLVTLEKWRRVQGYRLTNLGYDYLALKSLAAKDTVASIGRQIGVGKESDIFVCLDASGEECVIKFHRLGRTSFRKAREKRDYLPNHRRVNWLYFSRLAALKEFSFMQALHKHGFPVPQALGNCRHAVVMGLMPGYVLNQVHHLDDPGRVYDDLMNIIVRLASMGLIHGDFNEFNIMLSDEDEVFVIDFPQMISIDHYNARSLFERDVNCIRNFFKKRYEYETTDFPEFDSILRETSLDAEVEASGFSKEQEKELGFLNLADQKELSDDEADSPHSDQESSDRDHTEEEEDGSSDDESGTEEEQTEKIYVKNKQKFTQRERRRKDDNVSEEPPPVSPVEKMPDRSEERTIDADECDRIERELLENYERLYQPHLSSQNSHGQSGGQQTDSPQRQRVDSEGQSRVSAAGLSYVSTSIPPGLIKKRVRSQAARTRNMELCRRAIKQGESSLKTKDRQDKRLDIKESLDWG